ncbi:recombinase family protein [Nocardiopsis rhodophaea]|uniref:recombinase family protein n=1 Tax=Nocardiopsis rhodophaea TaxID=280238 RepID=UPI003CD0B934
MSAHCEAFSEGTGGGHEHAVGYWTASSVREISVNPTYTGYMVSNRRAHRAAGGACDPPEEWVCSP